MSACRPCEDVELTLAESTLSITGELLKKQEAAMVLITTP